MSDTHWTETADRISHEGSAHPLWGHVAESEDGDLLLPAWWWVQRRHRDVAPGGWWNRRLNLRCPWHWLPYLRSRSAGRLVWVEAP